LRFYHRLQQQVKRAMGNNGPDGTRLVGMRGIAALPCMYRNEVIDYLDYKIHRGAFTDG
jgi:hypothetical protein